MELRCSTLGQDQEVEVPPEPEPPPGSSEIIPRSSEVHHPPAVPLSAGQLLSLLGGWGISHPPLPDRDVAVWTRSPPSASHATPAAGVRRICLIIIRLEFFTGGGEGGAGGAGGTGGGAGGGGGGG